MHNYCCESMRYHICTTNSEDIWDNPDNLLLYDDVFDEYGLIIHDGGSSSVVIHYCPWCGSKLPNSRRDLWFETLEKLGYDAPLFSDEIPPEFKSSKWWGAIENK